MQRPMQNPHENLMQVDYIIVDIFWQEKVICTSSLKSQVISSIFEKQFALFRIS